MFLFPVELWEQILQDVEVQYLPALSRTCHLFHSIVQPYIYDEVELCATPDNEDGFYNWNTSGFMNSVTTRPELFRLVQTLRLKSNDEVLDNSYVPVDPIDASSSHPILRQITSFSKLRVLELYGFHIEPDCRAAIQSLTYLERVVLSHCKTSSDSIHLNGPQRAISGNRISELSIKSPKSGDGWTSIASKGLQSLTIRGDQYMELFRNTIISDFILSDALKTLTTLDLDIIPEKLSRLLKLVPNLQILSLPLDSNLSFAFGEDPLPAGAIPSLTQFKGSLEWCQVFIKGRPVHSVALGIGYDIPDSGLWPLQLSSVPIIKVELFAYEGAITVGSQLDLLLEHAPTTLKHLTWPNCVDPKHEKSLVALSCLTSLRTLVLHCDANEENRGKIAQAFLNACPSLQMIKFWGRCDRWVVRNGETWEDYTREKLFQWSARRTRRSRSTQPPNSPSEQGA